MGIMLYGQYPSGEMDRNYPLYPAMSLYSHITFIKTVKKGTGISYGHTFVTDKETKVATIPVGYADGLPRSLSGKGCVLINNVRCPILGRVCMDQLMVDVTEVDNVSVGDKVTVIGDDLTVDEVSCLAGSFNYEFICGISRRVPRVYTYNNEIIKIKSYLD
jgi:alanine racemase